ncbi:MAG: aminotransferase class I/II-fold pyridoxal phosphate-dependent enzyme [Burkholderiales bacterium]|nr:MAG: aminotransferase class I/II-fold pyridoxal phosphate-dependent enzyme [Burkholderiales bacterium]
MQYIELFSDTQTRPTAAMRAAMAAAEVGDEQRMRDPTVNRLRERICTLLGKDDAVFLPSGTMCNEIALAVHCRPGDEVICDATAHVVHFEGGGPAALAGVMARSVHGERGVFGPEAVRGAFRGDNRYAPRSRVVVVEQTANMGGGTVWPLATIESVAAAARECGLVMHLDGARLMNAVVATGVAAARYCAPFDSVWIDFTKGLGAPVGAVLAGDAAFIREAWRIKQRWGGAMRQAGILAAAALHALDHHVERLADDHVNARRLAEGLAALPGIAIDPGSVETNIVIFDVAGTSMTAAAFVAALESCAVGMVATGPGTVRAVTHLDVSADDIEEALRRVGAALVQQARP